MWPPRAGCFRWRTGRRTDRVDQLFEDRQRVLWISTERGVFRLEGNQLQSFAPGSALAGNRVLAMFEDREGRPVAGHRFRRPAPVARSEVHHLHHQRRSLRQFCALRFSKRAMETLWIGTDGAGLNRRTSPGLCPLLDRPGTVQQRHPFAGRRRGRRPLDRNPQRAQPAPCKRARVERFTSADGLPDDFIRSLYNDRDGSLWIGTRHGLAHLAGGKFSSFSSMDGLGSDFIGAILRSGHNAGPGPALDWHLRRAEPVRKAVSSATTPASRASRITPSPPSPRTTTGTLWLGTNGGGLNRVAARQGDSGLSLELAGAAEHHLRHARRRERPSLDELENRDLPRFAGAVERLASGAPSCGRSLRHGGRHEYPRMQRRGPPGGLEAG